MKLRFRSQVIYRVQLPAKMFRCGLLVLPPTQIVNRVPQVIQLAAKEVKEVLYVDFFRLQNSGLAGLHRLIVQIYGRHYPSQDSLDIRLLLPCADETKPRTLSKLPEAAFLFEYDEDISPESLQSWIKERYSGLSHEIQTRVLNQGDAKAQSLETSISRPVSRDYLEVVLGGTFDHIHNGHRLLLGVACLLCQKKITIGLADGPLLAKKVLKELIQPFEERKRVLEEMIKDIKPGKTVLYCIHICAN